MSLSDHAPEPQLSISNIPRVGEESKVTCSAQHTCFSSPPLLTISGILGSDSSTNIAVSEGVWEKKVERVWSPTEEDQSVKCTVRYPGGQTASSELRLNVECESRAGRLTWIANDWMLMHVFFTFRLRSVHRNQNDKTSR